MCGNQRPDKPEYRGVLARRVNQARCLEWIRDSRLQLPLVDYERLYRDAEDLESVPIGLLIFLARARLRRDVHVTASGGSPGGVIEAPIRYHDSSIGQL